MTFKANRSIDQGKQMHDFIASLYPICRSITGNGLRRSLALVQEKIPLEIHEVPTGTQVLDWTIPKEWNINDACVIAPDGAKIVDFQKHNLHVMNYSCPIDCELTLDELKPHLHTLASYPDWIPYRTSYYKEDWGFCMSHRQFLQLADGTYKVKIDSSLKNGSLSYGELYLKGATEDEILISCHICHPSLCNDNLSGVALSTFLAMQIQFQPHRYSYRFLFIPGTIGAIAWLGRNRERTKNIKHGLVVACVGDSGFMHYKKSRRGIAEIDRAVEHILKFSGKKYAITEFSPYGYDERQYCSPGFDLPVGSLTRTPHGQYQEYHSSADDLEFIKPESLNDSLQTYLTVIELLESNRIYFNTQPFGEPQLGKRGLYRSIGGATDTKTAELAMFWVLNLSDGSHSLLDIAERAAMRYTDIQSAASTLLEHELLRPRV